MSAHEASTLTHFDLCLLCRLAAAATAAADHSPGSAVLLSQPYRTAASFRPERFSLLGRVDCCPMPLPPIAPGTLFVTHPLCHRNTRPWLVEPPCSSYATTLRARRPHRWARLSLLRCTCATSLPHSVCASCSFIAPPSPDRWVHSPRHAAQREPSCVMLLLICRRSCLTLLCRTAVVQLADLLQQPSDHPAMPPSPARSQAGSTAPHPTRRSATSCALD